MDANEKGIIDCLAAQRNQALNDVAFLQGSIAALREQVEGLVSANQKLTEAAVVPAPVVPKVRKKRTPKAVAFVPAGSVVLK